MPDYEHDPNANYNEILVPTVETIRAAWILELLNFTKRPVMLIGEAGCSKTAITQNILRGLDPNIFVYHYHPTVSLETVVFVDFNDKCIPFTDSSDIEFFV